jgi:hypothetical protein
LAVCGVVRVAVIVSAAKFGPSAAGASCARADVTVMSVRHDTLSDVAGSPCIESATRSGNVDGLCSSACGYAGVLLLWECATLRPDARTAARSASASMSRCAAGTRLHLLVVTDDSFSWERWGERESQRHGAVRRCLTVTIV